MKLKLRTSSSIQPFREKAEKALGLKRYDYKVDGYDTPVVFLGLYHKGDYDSFKRPRVKRYVLWCGGDIQNFKRGYLYGDGKGLWKSKIARFFSWQDKIRKTEAEHFCENENQQEALEKLGIKAKVVPAFWGEINDFPISFKPSNNPLTFISMRKEREREYGIIDVYWLATKLKNFTFHIYGVNQYEDFIRPNIIYHGEIPSDQFDKEIKDYHCCLRPNKHDGLSDAVMKCLLNGGYPITRIKYPHIWNYNTNNQLIHLLKRLQKTTKPNIEGRNYYRKVLNQYPFLK